MRPEDVTAVVVSLGRSERLSACLESLRAEVASPERIVCVMTDPDSADSDAVSDSEGPDARFLHPGTNLGWAGGLQYARPHVETAAIWLIQDDVTVLPGALDALCSRLTRDPDLAAVRPVEVDDAGVIHPGRCGRVLDPTGGWARLVPEEATPADLVPIDAEPEWLLSSGTLVRAAAWDSVGGVNPWLYPVNFADVDFGLALRSSGWRLANEGTARMLHTAHTSTPTMLGIFTSTRNQMIFHGAWYPSSLPAVEERRRFISESCLRSALAWRASPTGLSAEELRRIAGVSAADSLIRLSRFAQRYADEHLRAETTPRDVALQAAERSLADAQAHTAAIESERNHLLNVVAEFDAAIQREASAVVVHREHVRTVEAHLRAVYEQKRAMEQTRAWKAHLAQRRLRSALARSLRRIRESIG